VVHALAKIIGSTVKIEQILCVRVRIRIIPSLCGRTLIRKQMLHAADKDDETIPITAPIRPAMQGPALAVHTNYKPER
jgi:hypothetical protein